MPEVDAGVELASSRFDLAALVQRAVESGGESLEFEFKEVLDYSNNDEHKIRLVKAIAAFGNTDRGGHIILGVSDDRRVVGLSEDVASTYDQTRIQNLLGSYLAPPPRVQVRQLVYQEHAVVVVEVLPFRDYPSVVKRHDRAGKERLYDGTFLVRTSGAESSVLRSEIELRALCEAIAARRAQAIVEIFHRGMRANSARASPSESEWRSSIIAMRKIADEYWPSDSDARAYLEVGFGFRGLRISGPELKRALQDARISVAHHYPFDQVDSLYVQEAKGWGLMGSIPYPAIKLGNPPGYLWLLGRDLGFVNREHFWEHRVEGLKGCVGVLHILKKAILLVRLVDRLARALTLSETRVEVSVVLNNVHGLRLVNERGDVHEPAPTVEERRVEASVVVTLEDLQSAREDLVLNLLEEVCWQFGRDDWSRGDILTMLRLVPRYEGGELAFPEEGP